MPGNAQILVDEDRMIQVFSNLMSNAIEYSPEGSLVMLRASEEKDQILLEVIDSGPGINEDDLPYVFERFHRADRARQHSEQHSGLGLAIAKEIVKAHKGEISLKSVIGKGTTIEIRLPKH
jgi:signal transduction histidine kinase